MRAKMPAGEVREAGHYLCQACQTVFIYETGTLTCPNCYKLDPQELIPVYMEDDADEEEMYSKQDWGSGD